ncbi:hypothetical protein [Lachnoclostridium sp. Marseille-P6806]|uniref:hypothetical protein n=1 Tax=Lachnoclostridium sp. Marseille-P6806 TaxID=2364793 RepID=UPI001031CB93|nr:hypothetical protein [Lachnoclostridium sp. Marseille-P6806]
MMREQREKNNTEKTASMPAQAKKRAGTDNPRRAAAAFFITAFLLLGAAAGAVFVVDPFFHYHAPLDGFPYVIDNQLAQNPGMAAHMEYDSVLLGSSMTFNYDMSWFREELGLHTLKLSYSGAYPRDIYNISKIIFDSKSDADGVSSVKRVFLGIDVFSYMADTEDIKFPIPEYLYDDNPLNDVNYLLNKDVLFQYVARPLFDPEPTLLDQVYTMSWLTEEDYSEEKVLAGYVPSERAAEETPPDAYLANTAANMEKNICPFIAAHPETQFTVFFPPYSILFWNDVLLENHLEATLAEYRLIAEKLLVYDNVELFCFPLETEITTGLDHYADYTHHSPEVAHLLLRYMETGRDRIDSVEEMDAAIDALREMALEERRSLREANSENRY